jgi:hypothetical protein
MAALWRMRAPSLASSSAPVAAVVRCAATAPEGRLRAARLEIPRLSRPQVGSSLDEAGCRWEHNGRAGGHMTDTDTLEHQRRAAWVRPLAVRAKAVGGLSSRVCRLASAPLICPCQCQSVEGGKWSALAGEHCANCPRCAMEVMLLESREQRRRLSPSLAAWKLTHLTHIRIRMTTRAHMCGPPSRCPAVFSLSSCPSPLRLPVPLLCACPFEI